MKKLAVIFLFFSIAVVLITINARILNIWARLECTERSKPCPEVTMWHSYWNRP